MSFKKTVTFTAKVSDYTDGTVTARVQAENNIVGQFVSWLLSNNTSIQQIEKVSIGDAKWSGYPLYAVQTGAPSVITTTVIESWSKLSDVYILGKNADNFCLAVSADGDVLSLAPCCSFAFQDALNAYSAKSISICLEQIRKLASSRQSTRTLQMGAIPLFTFNTSADEISMTLNYWKGSDSLVFGVQGDTAKVFFSFDSQDASWGWSFNDGKLNNYSFNEVIQASDETQTLTSNAVSSTAVCLSKGYATNTEPYWWGSMATVNSSVYYGYQYIPSSTFMHRMNNPTVGSSGSIAPDNFGVQMISSSTRICCGVRLENLPRITTEQLYLRKMYIPNRQTASPIKLGYTPGNLYADAVYAVNDKNYLCLQDGWYSFFVEVEDQN